MSEPTHTARDRVAVVTGGASGMGLSICRALAAAGDRVAVWDVNGPAAHRVSEELRTAGGTAMACKVDVTDRAAVDEALRKVHAEFGPVQVLITSAGLVGFAPFTEITPETWDRVIAVNLTGTFHCVQAAIPDMVAAGWGRIVTISSSSAQRGSPGMVHYTASKRNASSAPPPTLMPPSCPTRAPAWTACSCPPCGNSVHPGDR